jgi:hypothetical protein
VGNDTGKILKICRTFHVPEVSRQLSSSDWSDCPTVSKSVQVQSTLSHPKRNDDLRETPLTRDWDWTLTSIKVWFEFVATMKIALMCDEKEKKMAGSSEAWKWRSKNVISPRYWLMKKIMVGVPNLGDEDAKNVLSSREWLDWNKKKGRCSNACERQARLNHLLDDCSIALPHWPRHFKDVW